jgi:hypothetical protein
LRCRIGYGGTVRVLAGLALALLVTGAACGGGSHRDAERSRTVSALTVVEARTPPLQVPQLDTSGTYPQVTGANVDLRAVNAALRAAVLADQRTYAPYARREKPGVVYRERGVYRTAVDQRHISASTVVVSALLPLTRELFPGQHEGDGWLAMTVRVPSGRRVTISDLFKNPARGLRALAAAWKAKIRRTPGRPCLRIYPSQYRPTVANYRAFALTPSGIAVGSWEIAACYRLVATVPYRVLRPLPQRTRVRADRGSTPAAIGPRGRRPRSPVRRLSRLFIFNPAPDRRSAARWQRLRSRSRRAWM